MCASQLRYLYHLNRGEMGMAQVHRERVELHAARVGSAWQVEMWEPASLLPLYIVTDDVVELARISHRLAALAEIVPSMWRYRELAHLATELQTHSRDLGDRFWAECGGVAARSFIGWSTMLGGAALYYNRCGEHARALSLCELALSSMTDEDHDYVMIFLLVDLQAAVSEAGVGCVDQALARLDALIARHLSSGHALALGLLHADACAYRVYGRPTRRPTARVYARPRVGYVLRAHPRWWHCAIGWRTSAKVTRPRPRRV